MMEPIFLKSLICEKDIIDAIFKQCLNLWQYDSSGSISQFFERYEFYQKIYESIKIAKPEDRLSPEDKTIIILDGFSLREASLLIPELANNGYKISAYSYNLSTIPSDTQTFVREIFGASSLSFFKQWKEYRVQYISSGQIPKFLPEDKNLVIWLSFSDEILITSDHGYIYAKSASLFWKLHHDDEKIVKQIFKVGRSVKIEEFLHSCHCEPQAKQSQKY